MFTTRDALFIDTPDGSQRLLIHHAPVVEPVGVLVYVHPWAEEMNKSRRMAALASRALAAEGWAVVQPDLAGCGDSSGDLADATWDQWCDDVAMAARWARTRHPAAPLWFWGLRAGALLCTQAAARWHEPAHLLLWQPVPQGRAVLQQFLRLKAAAQIATGGGKAILEEARAELSAGRPVDVAGYALPPALAAGLEGAVLTPPAAQGRPQRLVWLEVAAGVQPPALTPAGQAALPRWQAAGWQVDALAVRGPAFWQTTEIEDAPALVETTVAMMAGTR